jgi:hypothetical protein
MKTQKLLIFISLVLLIVTGVCAQKYMTLEELRNMKKKTVEEQKVRKSLPKTEDVKPGTGMVVNLKEGETLAEGTDSKFRKPFVFVARTPEDYGRLKGLVDGFSSDLVIDFKKQAVIAAFAGMKNTGGYSIQIAELNGRTDIVLKSPPKDAMVTQAITYPYKVAVLNVQEEDSLNVAVSDDFQNEMTTYTVSSGSFEFEGGFINRQTKFDVAGTVGVMKHEELATFLYQLKGTGDEKGRFLFEMASGKLSADNSADIKRLEAGDFIDKPHPPLKVLISFEGNKLSMKFEPGKRDYVVNDGFVGRGSLTAVKMN